MLYNLYQNQPLNVGLKSYVDLEHVGKTEASWNRLFIF